MCVVLGCLHNKGSSALPNSLLPFPSHIFFFSCIPSDPVPSLFLLLIQLAFGKHTDSWGQENKNNAFPDINLTHTKKNDKLQKDKYNFYMPVYNNNNITYTITKSCRSLLHKRDLIEMAKIPA